MCLHFPAVFRKKTTTTPAHDSRSKTSARLCFPAEAATCDGQKQTRQMSEHGSHRGQAQTDGITASETAPTSPATQHQINHLPIFKAQLTQGDSIGQANCFTSHLECKARQRVKEKWAVPVTKVTCFPKAVAVARHYGNHSDRLRCPRICSQCQQPRP